MRSLSSIWGLLSFMNCLNESVGSKEMECWFLYFILLLPIMHNTSDDLDIQPVCSNEVVRINGLWWMPLLVDYVGSLVLFPIIGFSIIARATATSFCKSLLNL